MSNQGWPMKYCILIITLFLPIAGCSDSSLNSKSSCEQGVALAIEGKFKKAHKTFTEALHDDADKAAAQQSLEVINDSLS